MTQRSGWWWVLVLALGSGILAHAQTDPRRDGNWWRTVGTASKAAYVLGVFDGLVMGNTFSYWNLQGKDGKGDIVLARKVADSFNASYKMLSNTTNLQVNGPPCGP